MGQIESVAKIRCRHCNVDFFEKEGKHFKTKEDAERCVGGVLAPECPHCGAIHLYPLANVTGFARGVGEHAKTAASIFAENTATLTAIQNRRNQLRRNAALPTFVYGAASSILWIAVGFLLFQIVLRFWFSSVTANAYLLDLYVPTGTLIAISFTLGVVNRCLWFMALRMETEFEIQQAELRREYMAMVIQMVSQYWSRTQYKPVVREIGDALHSIWALFTIAAPFAFFVLPSMQSFLTAYRTITSLHFGWGNICQYVQGLFAYDPIGQNPNSKISKFLTWLKNNAWWVGPVALAVPVAIRAGRRRRRNKRAAVPKKREQQERDNVDEVMPVDPRSVPTVVLPNSPAFINSHVVHRSLMQVAGAYTATCFRSGQHLVTAIHCLAKNNDQHGVWVFNPDTKSFLWAPLEKAFRTAGSRIKGDGVAVCALPNSNFTLSRQSCSVQVPVSGSQVVGCYMANNDRVNPNWAFTTGNSSINLGTGQIDLWASIKPGSSGGPVLHPEGYIVGIVYAETQMHNSAFCITQDVVDFLAAPGKSDASGQGLTPSPEESSQSGSEITKSEILCGANDQELKIGMPGQKRPEKKNEPKPGSSIGDTPSDVGKDKKKRQERQQKPPGTIPDDRDDLGYPEL